MNTSVYLSHVVANQELQPSNAASCQADCCCTCTPVNSHELTLVTSQCRLIRSSGSAV